MPRKSKVEKREKHRRLIRGVKKHWMKEKDLKVAGVHRTPDELVDGLQSLIDQHDRTARAYGAWRTEVARERALEKRLGPLVRSVEKRALSEFGESPKLLAEFGMRYAKPGPRTLESKKQMLANRKKNKEAGR